MLNSSIRYSDNILCCDSVPASQIANEVGTPVYIYSLKRTVENLHRIQSVFADLDSHVRYSAKANSNLAVLRSIVAEGAGIDVVSAGEIYRALAAGTQPEDIVFAGSGKTPDEIRYAVEKGVGWFNVENVDECRQINDIAAELSCPPVNVALRLNPDVTASTHPYIATGHGGAKFGLAAETAAYLLAHQGDYSHLQFAGIHIHIGSQLHDTQATYKAVQAVLDLIQPHPAIRTINIGGGFPVAYKAGEQIPSLESFAESLKPLLAGYTVLLEPGRSVIADAGILVVRVLYVKKQAGQTFLITDGSMAELIRPALYQAHHEIVPAILHSKHLNSPHPSKRNGGVEPGVRAVNIVGPVCETSDVLGRDVLLPEMQPGDLLAILTAGAYGMVMASNYNARPRPPEVVVAEDGESWHIGRRRETWEDLLRHET